jgi:hypothetical protein
MRALPAVFLGKAFRREKYRIYPVLRLRVSMPPAMAQAEYR